MVALSKTLYIYVDFDPGQIRFNINVCLPKRLKNTTEITRQCHVLPDLMSDHVAAIQRSRVSNSLENGSGLFIKFPAYFTRTIIIHSALTVWKWLKVMWMTLTPSHSSQIISVFTSHYDKQSIFYDPKTSDCQSWSSKLHQNRRNPYTIPFGFCQFWTIIDRHVMHTEDVTWA